MSGVLLVGLDGSEGSARALDYAIAQAQAGGQSLLLASVIPHSPHSFLTMNEISHNEAMRREQQQKARAAVLDPACGKVAAAGIAVDTRLSWGNPSDVLAEIAEDAGADAIVVGRRGLTQVRALMFGSVASSVVQRSPVPVTVVP